MERLFIREYQEEIDKWTDYNFGETKNPTVVALGTMEEVGEVAEAVLSLVASSGKLSRAVLKQHQQIRGTWEEWQDQICKELGDVFIKLCDLAAVTGIDLETAISDRWNVIRQRDFKANPTGHGLPKDDHLVQCPRCTAMIMVIPSMQAVHDRLVHGIGPDLRLLDPRPAKYDYEIEGLGGT